MNAAGLQDPTRNLGHEHQHIETVLADLIIDLAYVAHHHTSPARRHLRLVDDHHEFAVRP